MSLSLFADASRADTEMMNGRDQRAPAAAPDLFDLAPARPQRDADEVSSLPWLRLILIGSVSLAIAWLFRFPPWALMGLSAAALLSQTLRHRRLLRRFAWTAVTAAFAAQLTDVFVSPFTWLLRFGFFAILFGVAVIFWGLRTDEFAQ
jgi:hypothetical protein